MYDILDFIATKVLLTIRVNPFLNIIQPPFYRLETFVEPGLVKGHLLLFRTKTIY